MLLKIPKCHFKILALSGHHKAGFCFAAANDAFICDHVFDLSTKEGITFFKRTLDKCCIPDIIASDMHPDFASTKIAAELAQNLGIKHIKIRHHQAHIAAVTGEHDIRTPVLGLALDGLGFGENGELWGGELLKIANGTYQRLGRLKPIRLPGGDAATKDIKRIAAAFLYDKTGKADNSLPPLLQTAIKKHINTPFTSSCGRLFDLALALTNTPNLATFERQATNPKPLKNGFTLATNNGLLEADLSPVLLHIFKNGNNASNYFHGTLSEALCNMAIAAKNATGITSIALGGGCFLNQVLTEELESLLTHSGFTVLLSSVLPPSDTAVPFGIAESVIQQNA